MVYKSVSCKRTINEVFASFSNILAEHSDRLIGNATEWIGMALEGIGSTAPLITKEELFTIKNGQVAIPCDLYLIKGVSYCGEWVRYGSQIFNSNLHCEDCVNANITSGPYIYTVNPGYLTTNIDDGEQICIIYQAFPLDEDGFPLVPDNYSVQQALFWFLTMKLMLGGFEHPDRSINFESAEARWLKYCTQAGNQTSMFDIPQMESFVNQWVRLIPQINSKYNFYSSLANREFLT